MSDSLLELDGAFGEGGGQILRTSLALSLLTGRAFHLRNVRAGRSKPGLQPQHLQSVRAAAAIRAATKPLGLAIRAGIHTGEVELAAGDVRGLAVHVAARIMALAGPNQVYVSATTHELVGDSGLTFVDAGIHELKGVSGARQVYRLAEPENS